MCFKTDVSFVRRGLLFALALFCTGLLAGCAPPSTEPVAEVPRPISPEGWRARGQTFAYRGQTVFYLAEGTGSAILLLHGYPMSSFEFSGIWDALSARHTVIAPDFLGYGFSGKPPEYPYSVADYADMLGALVALEGLGRVKLIAHDVGVLVAAELVSRAQQQSLDFELESVIMLNGALFSSERRPSFVQSLLGGALGGLVNNLASESSLVSSLTAISGPTGASLRPAFAAQWALLNFPGSARIMHKLSFTVGDRRVNEQRWVDDLCASPVPLRFIVGLADPTSGQTLPASLRAHCGRAFSAAEFTDVGHFPHLEAPERTLEAVFAWREGGY